MGFEPIHRSSSGAQPAPTATEVYGLCFFPAKPMISQLRVDLWRFELQSVAFPSRALATSKPIQALVVLPRPADANRGSHGMRSGGSTLDESLRPSRCEIYRHFLTEACPPVVWGIRVIPDSQYACQRVPCQAYRSPRVEVLDELRGESRYRTLTTGCFRRLGVNREACPP